MVFLRKVALRSRERNLWADTPVAKLFTDESEWHLLGARSLADNLRGTLNAIQLDGGNIPTGTLVHIFASVAQKEARATALSVKSNVGVKETRGVHSWTPSEIRSSIAYIKCMVLVLLEYRKSDETVRRSQNSSKACRRGSNVSYAGESEPRQIKFGGICKGFPSIA